MDLDTFTILGNWVVSQGRAASLIRLKEQLRTIDIANITVCKEKDSISLLSAHLESHSIRGVLKDRFPPKRIYTDLLNLSKKLVRCWRSIGRLLGISRNELEIIVEEKFESQPYHLINNWQMGKGDGATFGALFKAIHRVFHYQVVLVNDAHHFCERYVRNHLPIPVTVPSLEHRPV